MAEGVRGDRGGTLGLLDLLEEHWEAIDYDLLGLGLDINDLGTRRLDWRRLRAVVAHLPPTSALSRSMHGPAAEWGTTEHLLAAAVDALVGANWQRAGGKGQRPKPITGPGDEKSKRLGTASLSISEAQEFFDRVNRQPPASAITAPQTPSASCSEDGCGRPVKARGMCPKHYQRWWRSRR